MIPARRTFAADLTVSVHLDYLAYTPSGPRPAAGWPLVLFLHGAGALRRARPGVRAQHVVHRRRAAGEEDDVVDAEDSRVQVAALQAVGADVRLTLYPGVGHDAWTKAYATPELWAWALAQRRTGGVSAG